MTAAAIDSDASADAPTSGRLFLLGDGYLLAILKTHLERRARAKAVPLTLATGFDVGPNIRLIRIDDSPYELKPSNDPGTPSVERPFWLPERFEVARVERSGGRSTEKSYHALQAIAEFAARHRHRITLIDATQERDVARYTVEDLIHYDLPAPKVQRVHIRSNVADEIDAALGKANDLSIDSLRELRPIDVRRQAGYVFTVNILDGVVAKLRAANFPHSDDLHLSRPMLAALTIFHDLLQRSNEVPPFAWQPLAIMQLGDEVIAVRPDGVGGCENSPAAEAAIRDLPPFVSVLEVREKPIALPRTPPMTFLDLIEQDQAAGATLLRHYEDAATHLWHNGGISYPYVTGRKWTTRFFNRAVPDLLACIKPALPNLEELCDEARTYARTMRDSNTAPAAFMAEGEDRATLHLTNGVTNAKKLQELGTDEISDVARRLWTLLARNLLEHLLPDAIDTQWSVVLGAGEHRFIYKTTQIRDLGWRRVAQMISHAEGLPIRPPTPPARVGDRVSILETRIAPHAVSTPAPTEIDLLRALAESDEALRIPFPRLLAGVRQLFGARLISRENGVLRLTDTGKAVIAITPLALHGTRLHNAIVAETNERGGKEESLLEYQQRIYRLYNQLYDELRAVKLEKRPKWKAKGKGRDDPDAELEGTYRYQI